MSDIIKTEHLISKIKYCTSVSQLSLKGSSKVNIYKVILQIITGSCCTLTLYTISTEPVLPSFRLIKANLLAFTS